MRDTAVVRPDGAPYAPPHTKDGVVLHLVKRTLSRHRAGTLAATLAACCAALTLSPPTAPAASVAYIEAGNVWLASPDGTKKVQLTTTGTPAKPWLGVAQAPDGRTAAVYDNDPGGNANSAPAVVQGLGPQRQRDQGPAAAVQAEVEHDRSAARVRDQRRR